MSEEIKEILDEMLWQFEKYPTDDFIVKNKESRILLNYITNLQKENENLKETLQTDRLMKAFMVEHNRNEKAIEYIEKNKQKIREITSANSGSMVIYELCCDSDDLLNILQGGNE